MHTSRQQTPQRPHSWAVHRARQASRDVDGTQRTTSEARAIVTERYVVPPEIRAARSRLNGLGFTTRFLHGPDATRGKRSEPSVLPDATHDHSAAFSLTMMIVGVVLLAGVAAWWLGKQYQTGPALASTEDVSSSPSGA